MINKYIPIKDAINILEDCKLDLVTYNNDFPYNDPDPSSESLGTVPVEGRHALNIIKLAAKRWNSKDNKSHTNTNASNILHLYGKKSPCETAFEKVYIDQFPTGQTVDITYDYTTGEVINEITTFEVITWDYSKYNCDLFENYNYTNRYDPNINYTVLGHKRSDTIQYYDISLDYAEFMEFIDKIFKDKSNDK